MGRKVATCKEQRQFLAGGGGPYCTQKDSHAFHRRKVPRKCCKCAKLDGTKFRARELLKSLRENVDKRAAARSGAPGLVVDSSVTLSDGIESRQNQEDIITNEAGRSREGK
ncbi:hypothetical protein ACHAQH_006876 [Verticillium albo-atrum]